MAVVLALDIAMHRTGWALGGTNWTKPFWGVFETASFTKLPGRNLNRFREFLDGVASKWELTHVAREEIFVDVRNGGERFQVKGTEAQHKLDGVVDQFAALNGLPYLEIGIDDWRKRFLGLNRRPKDARGDEKYWKNLAIKRCAQANIYVTHDDEAEAIGILDYALAVVDKQYRLKTKPGVARIERDLDHKRGIFA